MSDDQIGPILLLLLVLVAAAHLLGHLFSYLRQPRVIGEIAAGVLLGPIVLKHLSPGLFAALWGGPAQSSLPTHVLDFIYSMGLLLLMFVSGSEVRSLFGSDDRRQVAWLASVGTGMPFLIAILLAPIFPLNQLAGPSSSRTALLLVVGIAVAVTSIPVISRIFHDLGITHTRFARLVLAVAVIEDVFLWVALAIATTLAKSVALAPTEIVRHILLTLAFFLVGLKLAPPLLRRLNRQRWNILAKAAPTGYLIAIMFAFCAIAGGLGVNLVFAAFIAGYAVAQDHEMFSAAIEGLSRFSFAFFIPLYFLLVGFRLKLDRDYSLLMLATFLVVACAVKLASVGLGARLAGFKGLDIWNLAVATNARGGPGIVLASVAYDAGIVNAQAFTTLVLIAVLTSQAAGVWIETVLKRGLPLLSPAPVIKAAPKDETDLQAA
jgi:Kef-type K+ transport system membrane component KefB